jgi:hypothetical protein
LDTGAPQDEKVTRAEVADMIVKHYKDVLKQTIVRKDSCDPKNYSDYKSMNTATRENIYDVCSLGLMGWSNDRKIQIKNFRPSDYMTK